MAQEYPTQEQYPTLASTDNFEVWEDRDEGSVILAFNINGVTVAIDRVDFGEFAQVVSDAAKKIRAGGMS
ncbi:MAG: hypothetical protein ACUVX1_17335 [Chloroflexota bacterium]